VCDVDYSTLSDINAEFVVKRDGNDVSNAFGDWVGYWVDMWEEHAGELHINLGPGADGRTFSPAMKFGRQEPLWLTMPAINFQPAPLWQL
jgi:ABC-type amino acid transport substrate-binding protein